MKTENTQKLPDAACLLPGNGRTAQDTLLMALELSALAYDMRIGRFLDDGWQDASFQVDELLLTGFETRRACEQAAAKARSRMEKLGLISQYRAFKREKEELSTCKAVVLARQLPNGRALIAVAFTGTTRRIYEWLGNLRLEEEEGFHAGFLQLTKLFEENEGKIAFPALAAQTGRKSLTLRDILQEMRAGSKRYCLFITGHSQGAALMQIYMYRLIHSGVPREYLRGAGFASPGVAAWRDIALAAEYPVINVINADDVIARMGGQMHIGTCLVLPRNAAYRRACYGEKADTPVMQAALDMLHGVRSTQEALLLFIALAESFLALPEEECEEVLSSLVNLYLPDALNQQLAGYARRIVRFIGRALRRKCIQVTGEVCEEEVLRLQGGWNAYFDACGVREGAAALAEALMRPHSLAETGQKRAYQTLVAEYADRLVPCIWMQKGDPVWDTGYEEEKKYRRDRAAYDRFRPLSTQRRRNCDDD